VLSGIPLPKQRHDQEASMTTEKEESNGLIWALAALVLVVASIGAFYIWNMQPKVPTPIFVDVGEVKAYAGGKRMIVANVVLEVAGKKSEEKVAERLSRARTAIINSFHAFSENHLATQEGKQDLQLQIRDDLNELFGKRAVRDVLFTNFVLSVH
jgi:flagellar basal body-associated protein FliL